MNNFNFILWIKYLQMKLENVTKGSDNMSATFHHIKLKMSILLSVIHTRITWVFIHHARPNISSSIQQLGAPQSCFSVQLLLVASFLTSELTSSSFLCRCVCVCWSRLQCVMVTGLRSQFVFGCLYRLRNCRWCIQVGTATVQHLGGVTATDQQRESELVLQLITL